MYVCIYVYMCVYVCVSECVCDSILKITPFLIHFCQAIRYLSPLINSFI